MKRSRFGVRRSLTLAVALVVLSLPSLCCAQETLDAFRQLWNDPAVNERIDRNIERYRKGDATLKIVDADGRAVPEAEIEVRQQTHAFLFGCNAFVLGQLKPEALEQRYEQAFVALFNFATVPFYWAGTEPNEGELRYAEPARDIWRRPPPGRFVPWAAQHGLTLKGHPLLWHAHNPPWLPKDADALRELYRKRFREIATRFAEHVPIWDVVNESLVCPQTYQLFTPDRDYVRWAFAEVAPLFPERTTLMINEVTGASFEPMASRYADQIKGLRAQGATIRGIGFQYHYFRREALDRHLASANCNPGKMLDVYERFGEFDLPLYVTEITIPSAGEGGVALQAEVVRGHYRLWFSAPRMAGITWWNLGDGTAVQGENEAQGGLMDAELKPKAAYRALDQLINHDWKTQASLTTDPRGEARFRGFYGTYAVTIRANGQTRQFTIRLAPDGPTMHQLDWKP